MGSQFEYFVVLAGMRTGSNLLEEHLSTMPGLESWGELFNPHFFGKPDETEQFGTSIEERNKDPIHALRAMKSASHAMPGFRLFYDHDPRVIEYVLNDPKAAKIILSRRPIDSYVSLKIARKTGQWWLGDVTSRKSAKVAFDQSEYADFVNSLTGFQSSISRILQTTGQTAFFVSYDDLVDDDIIRGLAKYLNAGAMPESAVLKAKVQNPAPLASKLTNPEEATVSLQQMQIPDIGYMPSFEPERGPGLRMFRVCTNAPLLYMPIRGAGIDPIPGWMKQIDLDGKLQSGMTQKDLRRWKRQHPDHRSFTVLRHPLARAYDSFNRHLLPVDEDAYADIRSALENRFEISLPGEWPTSNWSLESHREAFLKFLKFVAANLTGQTSLRVDNSWASQSTLLSAIAQFSVPDRVIRENEMDEELTDLAERVGRSSSLEKQRFSAPAPFSLADVVNGDVNDACETAYRRDYVMFGFSSWN